MPKAINAAGVGEATLKDLVEKNTGTLVSINVQDCDSVWASQRLACQKLHNISRAVDALTLPGASFRLRLIDLLVGKTPHEFPDKDLYGPVLGKLPT